MSRARELIQDFVNLLEKDEDLQLEFARAFLTSRTLRRLLSDPNLQDTLRKAVMSDALLQVPEKIDALAAISVKVDRSDVQRARRQAEVLRRAGLEVTPVVIGSTWAHRQTPNAARKEGVESVVKGVYSQGLIEFRRYRSA